jgi:hypothetical protein
MGRLDEVVIGIVLFERRKGGEWVQVGYGWDMGYSSLLNLFLLSM